MENTKEADAHFRYDDYVPWDYLKPPVSVEGQSLYVECQKIQQNARYALGIKTYTVRDTHDGHVAVNGEVIMNYSPEYQIFRSSKYSQPRDASGFIKPDPPISNEICSPRAEGGTENISAALSRKRRGRAVHEHGQDPETGEVNPRLEAVINFPGYKAAVDAYFAHFSAQHQSNDGMYSESKL